VALEKARPGCDIVMREEESADSAWCYKRIYPVTENKKRK
jgi:hypothetical protein